MGSARNQNLQEKRAFQEMQALRKKRALQEKWALKEKLALQEKQSLQEELGLHRQCKKTGFARIAGYAREAGSAKDEGLYWGLKFKESLQTKRGWIWKPCRPRTSSGAFKSPGPSKQSRTCETCAPSKQNGP